MHGWGGSLGSFAAIAKELSPFYKVNLIDFYGFGKTPHPDRPLQLADYADAIMRLIGHYNMEKVILVAHSFGARVALLLAWEHPEIIKKMVIVSGAGIKPRRGIRYYYRHYRHKLLSALGIPHKAGSPDYRKLSPVMKKTFRNIVGKDLTPLLEEISTPTLLIWGNRDRQTPLYMARKMHKRLPCSKLVVLKGAGHFCYLEKHNIFYKAVFYFLQGESYECNP